MDPQLLAMLAQLGLMDSKGLTNQSKQTNITQDLLFNMLMNPMFGVLTNTFDPLSLPAPPPAYNNDELAAIEVYLNDPSVMGEIANGLLSKKMTPVQAMTLAKREATTEGSALFGMDERQIQDEIMRINDAVVKNDSARVAYERDAAGKQQEDIFTKAGLPSMLEQYTAETVPVGADVQFFRQKAAQLGNSAARQAGNSARPKLMQNPPKSAGTAVVHEAKATGATPVPRSMSGAREWAKEVGLDEDMLERWYSQAFFEARKPRPNEKQSMSPEDKNAWSSMTPQERSDFERVWQRFLDKSQRGSGNPIIDSFNKGQREKVEELSTFKPRADLGGREAINNRAENVVDPAWAKQRDLSQAYQNRADEISESKARVMTKMGRTPLGDALNQRMAMLRQLGLV